MNAVLESSPTRQLAVVDLLPLALARFGDWRIEAAALRGNPPTLTLGTMRDRLGFTITADFLAELGFEATPVKAARLYRECEFGDICQCISERALSVGHEYAVRGM